MKTEQDRTGQGRGSSVVRAGARVPSAEEEETVGWGWADAKGEGGAHIDVDGTSNDDEEGEGKGEGEGEGEDERRGNTGTCMEIGLGSHPRQKRCPKREEAKEAHSHIFISPEQTQVHFSAVRR